MATYPKLFNPSTPLGQSLSQISDAFLSGPSSLERAKTRSVNQETNARVSLADLVRQGDAANRTNELFSQGVLSGDIGQIDGLYRALIANQNGAKSPLTDAAVVGAGGPFSSTFQGFDATRLSNESQNAARIAGSERNNAANNAAALDRLLFETNNDRVNVLGEDGQPTIALHKNAIDARPVLSKADETGFRIADQFDTLNALQQQAVIGAAPSETQFKAATAAEHFGDGFERLNTPQKRFLDVEGDSSAFGTPFEYHQQGPDGQTVTGLAVQDKSSGKIFDARSGAELAQGAGKVTKQLNVNSVDDLTTTTKSNIQKSRLALQRAGRQVSRLTKMIKENPSIVGTVGNLRRGAQLAREQLEVYQDLFGVERAENFQDIRDAVARQARGSKMSDELLSVAFDPNLSAVEALANMVVFNVAAGTAGQSSRDVSDRDFNRFQRTIGDPTSFFETARGMTAKLNLIQEVIQEDLASLPSSKGAVRSSPSRNVEEALEIIKRSRGE